MKERPILFSGPMVRAILAGTKTQTRRVVKPQPHHLHILSPAWGTSPDGYAFGTPNLWRENGPDYPDGPDDDRACPYGFPGDRLWVRETWGVLHDDHVRDQRADMVILQATEGEDRGNRYQRWRPSIHMPRWACRLELELTQVRVERLQDISEGDAKAEGMAHDFAFSEGLISRLGGQRPMLVGCFAELWDDLNAKRGFGWEINPWVWALTFKRVESRTR